MRSIKVIGFVLLLALWFPGLFTNGASFVSSGGIAKTQSDIRLTEAKTICDAQTFHQLRLQSTPGYGQYTPAPGLIRETQSPHQSPFILGTFSSASPPNPTSILWHVLNPTEFPRAPSA